MDNLPTLGLPGATWRRALTDDEIQAIHTALAVTPFDPEPLILSGAKTITWEAVGVRHRITNEDGVVVWWLRDPDYDGDDPDGAWTIDKITTQADGDDG
jgi:hypothetical protein